MDIVCRLNWSIDVDECAEGVHDCDQECINNAGSFTCSCANGYELAEDGYTCNGKTVYCIS